MIYSLYILKHPETNETFYMGVTTDVKMRTNAHRSKHINTKYFYPIMDVLMTFSKPAIALAVEKNTIKSLKEIGIKLENSDHYRTGYTKRSAA